MQCVPLPRCVQLLYGDQPTRPWLSVWFTASGICQLLSVQSWLATQLDNNVALNLLQTNRLTAADTVRVNKSDDGEMTCSISKHYQMIYCPLWATLKWNNFVLLKTEIFLHTSNMLILEKRLSLDVWFHSWAGEQRLLLPFTLEPGILGQRVW